MSESKPHLRTKGSQDAATSRSSHQQMPRSQLAGLLVALVILLLGFGVTASGDINTGGIVILVGAVVGIMFKALRF